MSFKCISIDDAKVLMDSSEVNLVDIRDSRSFLDSNIPNAVHITGENVEAFLSAADKTKPLIVYCYHGHSSQGAADYFYSQGFASVYSMDGGFEGWRTKY